MSAPSNVAFNKTIEAELHDTGVPALNIMIRLGHAEAMKQAVLDHGWVTFLPAYCTARERADGRLHEISVQGLSLREQIVLVQRKEPLPSPLQLTTREAIRNAVSSHAL